MSDMTGVFPYVSCQYPRTFCIVPKSELMRVHPIFDVDAVNRVGFVPIIWST